MKEKDIRDRIAQFLKKTARTVVVPASMGLGLSAAGCERHALQGKPADGGPDLVAENSDTLASAPDLADAATKDDLPLMNVPYLAVMVEDAAADVAADALEAPSVDADRVDNRDADRVDNRDADRVDNRDTDRDASEAPLDVRPDIPFPPPPYVVFSLAADKPLATGAPGTSPGPLAPPEKK
jgi:hypothetical protein